MTAIKCSGDPLSVRSVMSGFAMCTSTRTTPGVEAHQWHMDMPPRWQKVLVQQDIPSLCLRPALWVDQASHR